MRFIGSPQAFEKISAQLKGMSKDQLSQLDLNLLVDLMARSANGERVQLPTGSPLKPIHTNATLARPSAVSSPDASKNGANNNPFSVSPSHQTQPLLAPVLPPLRGFAGAGAGAGVGVGAISVSEEKAAMAGEVKRISLEYNEEKQKLDLMMKIQQARQRQLLQRKLFEKSQRKQQEQQQQQQRADGLFDIDEDGNEYTAYADGKSEYNSVEIGANRGLSNLKLKQANSLQPAFKVRTFLSAKCHFSVFFLIMCTFSCYEIVNRVSRRMPTSLAPQLRAVVQVTPVASQPTRGWLSEA